MILQLLITLLVCVSWTFGMPAQGPVSIVKDERTPLANGTYSYDIILTDGTRLKQSGVTESKSEGDSPALVIMGEYQFVDDKGMTHKVTYVADKNGFQPEGDGIFKAHVGAKTNSTNPSQSEEPLKTISSSIFSSPSRF